MPPSDPSEESRDDNNDEWVERSSRVCSVRPRIPDGVGRPNLVGEGAADVAVHVHDGEVHADDVEVRFHDE